MFIITTVSVVAQSVLQIVENENKKQNENMHNRQLENVVLISFDTFRPIFLCKHRIENLQNKSCLSHRDKVFDTKFDSFRYFLVVKFFF